MRKVNNTKLNRDLKYDINEAKLVEFNNILAEYKRIIDDINSIAGYSIENINRTSFITHLLAKKSSIGTNTIEKVIVDEETLETELVSKSDKYKNEDRIKVVINFLKYYEINSPLDWDNLSNNIKDIHKDIFKGVIKNAGKFKKQVNFIPEEKEFLDPELVEIELAKLGSFIANSSFHNIAIAAIAHAKFIEIHPFPDGNGRMGRLLSNKLIERLYGVPIWIDEAMSKTLTRYVSALDSFSFNNNPSEIVNYFIDMTIQQSRRNISLLQDVMDKAIMMSESSDISINKCFYIVSIKSFNVAMFSNEFNIHRATAKSHLDKLVQLGYLEVKELGKTNVYTYK